MSATGGLNDQQVEELFSQVAGAGFIRITCPGYPKLDPVEALCARLERSWPMERSSFTLRVEDLATGWMDPYTEFSDRQIRLARICENTVTIRDFEGVLIHLELYDRTPRKIHNDIAPKIERKD